MMARYDMTKIQIYFEIINKIEPQSIIDASMYLKQIGAITRSFKTYEIPKNVYMVGIESEKTPVIIPELDNVYNSIQTVQAVKEDEYCKFELGTMFDCDKYMNDIEIKKMIEVLKSKCRYIYMDGKAMSLLKTEMFQNTIELKLEETKYCICY